MCTSVRRPSAVQGQRPLNPKVVRTDCELQKVKEVRGQGRLNQLPEPLRKESLEEEFIPATPEITNGERQKLKAVYTGEH